MSEAFKALLCVRMAEALEKEIPEPLTAASSDSRDVPALLWQ